MDTKDNNTAAREAGEAVRHFRAEIQDRLDMDFDPKGFTVSNLRAELAKWEAEELRLWKAINGASA